MVTASLRGLCLPTSGDGGSTTTPCPSQALPNQAQPSRAPPDLPAPSTPLFSLLSVFLTGAYQLCPAGL